MSSTDPELLDLLHKKIPQWIQSDEFPLENIKQELPHPTSFSQDSCKLRYFLAYQPNQAIELSAYENTQAKFHGWIEFIFQKDLQVLDWIFSSYQGFISGKPFSGKII